VNPKAVVTDIEIKETIAAIQRSGRKMLTLNANNESEIDAAFALAAEQKAGGLIVSADPYFTSRRSQIVALAARYAIPAIYPLRQYADAGGLVSYGPNLEHAYHDAGTYAGRILKGASPKTLPVALPTTFNLVINLKAAKGQGFKVSPLLLAIANDVIE
jgi:putative ABC transport system substrate-binding protein